jgi:hypothetical protein
VEAALIWEQSISAGTTEIHVVYMARPDVEKHYPVVLRDFHAAQAQVAELWKQRDQKAVDAMVKVTNRRELRCGH